MFTTAAAVSLIIYGAAKDATVCMAHAHYPSLNVNKWVHKKENEIQEDNYNVGDSEWQCVSGR